MRRFRRCIARLDTLNNWAILMALLLVLSYTISLGAREHWAFDLFRHFMHQYLIGSLILGPFLLIRKRFIIGGLTALVGIACLYEIVSRLDVAPPAPTGTQTIKVVHYNRHWHPRDHTDMKEWLLQENPDIFVIQEATDTHAKAINDLKDIYPYQIQETRQSAWGLILASKYPILDSTTHVNKRYAINNFYVHALIALPDGRKLSVYTAHPPPPTGALLQTQRNEDLKTIARAIQADPQDNIVFMGDWNITAYSPYFDDLLKETSLKNQYTSYYPFPTWPSHYGLPLFQIPIDHILFKGNLALTERKRGPAMGSDHYSISATFALN